MDVISLKSYVEKSQTNNFKFKPYTLIVRKFNPQYYSKKLLKSEMSEFFNSPDKFLDIHSHLCINKKINLNRIMPIDMQAQKERSLKESIKNIKRNSKYSSFLKERQLSNQIGNNKENQQIKKHMKLLTTKN